MRRVPVDARRQDWPRLVAQVVNSHENAIKDATGWGAYTHGSAAQSLAANTKTTLVNDKATVIETEKPSDIATFYDGADITGRSGDGISIRVELTFTPDDGTASYFWVAVDIGDGSPIEIFPRRFEVTGGALVGHQISYTMPAYTLGTWEANGGVIRVESDGPGEIDGITYVIHRLHKAN